VLGYTAWRAWRLPGLHTTARNIVFIVVAQALTGIATVYLDFPLAIAVLHNAGAAALVLVVTMLNYKVQYQLDPVSQNPRRSAAAPASYP
jgi:heme a synthase